MADIAPRPFTDPLVECFDLRSEHNGRDYEVRIGLPVNYPHGDGAYPVLVVLDADVTFGTAYETAIVEALASRSPLAKTATISEFLVVGIALPDRMTNPLRRNYEYMLEFDPAECAPETAAYLRDAEAALGVPIKTGGAAEFLDVLTGEILPLVERHYRVDPTRRMLFGHSAGGTFACATLFTKPESFTDYAIGSPGSFGGELFRLEQQWADDHDDLPASVTIRAGLGELADPLRMASNTARLAETLHARRYPSLALDASLLPGTSHVQVHHCLLTRALSVPSVTRA